jgi:hypothetical protein
MLSAWDLGQLGNKSGVTRLGFAVLLKFFQRTGRFPAFKNDVPGAVISFVATQVGVALEAYLQYDWHTTVALLRLNNPRPKRGKNASSTFR